MTRAAFPFHKLPCMIFLSIVPSSQVFAGTFGAKRSLAGSFPHHCLIERNRED